MDISEQDFTTGNLPSSTPQQESAAEVMAEDLKPAQAQNGRASISASDLLALLQTDFSDLQKLGLKAAILAKDDTIVFALQYHGHKFGFVNGHIILDGEAVTK